MTERNLLEDAFAIVVRGEVVQGSRSTIHGQCIALPELHKQHELFSADRDSILGLHGFVGAFTDAAILSWPALLE